MPPRKRKKGTVATKTEPKRLRTGDEIVAARVQGKSKKAKTEIQLIDSAFELLIAQRVKTKKDTAYRQIAFTLLYTFIGADGKQPGLGELDLYLLIVDFVLDARDLFWEMIWNTNAVVYDVCRLSPAVHLMTSGQARHQCR